MVDVMCGEEGTTGVRRRATPPRPLWPSLSRRVSTQMRQKRASQRETNLNGLIDQVHKNEEISARQHEPAKSRIIYVKPYCAQVWGLRGSCLQTDVLWRDFGFCEFTDSQTCTRECHEAL